jgi:hypothetical protein
MDKFLQKRRLTAHLYVHANCLNFLNEVKRYIDLGVKVFGYKKWEVIFKAYCWRIGIKCQGTENNIIEVNKKFKEYCKNKGLKIMAEKVKTVCEYVRKEIGKLPKG